MMVFVKLGVDSAQGFGVLRQFWQYSLRNPILSFSVILAYRLLLVLDLTWAGFLGKVAQYFWGKATKALSFVGTGLDFSSVEK